MNKEEIELLLIPTEEELKHEEEMILMSEFLGAEFGNHRRLQQIFNSSNEYYWDWVDSPGSYFFKELVLSSEDVFYPHEMQFKSSWDWLMTVIEKIGTIRHPKWEEMLGRVTVASHKSTIDWGENTLGPPDTFYNFNADSTLIERTYDVCIRFVKWHKENTRKE
jgi:hypothetical protein